MGRYDVLAHKSLHWGPKGSLVWQPPWERLVLTNCPLNSLLQGKRVEEARGVFSALEQLLQRDGLLLKYSASLPLLLRRTAGLLH